MNVNYLEAHHDVHDSWHARRLTFTDSIYLFFIRNAKSRLINDPTATYFFSLSLFFFFYIITHVKTDRNIYWLVREMEAAGISGLRGFLSVEYFSNDI